MAQDTPQFKQSQGAGTTGLTNIISPTEVNVNRKKRGTVPKGPRSVKKFGKQNKKDRLQMAMEGLRGARS